VFGEALPLIPTTTALVTWKSVEPSGFSTAFIPHHSQWCLEGGSFELGILYEMMSFEVRHHATK
jgi:hypothetical protein